MRTTCGTIFAAVAVAAGALAANAASETIASTNVNSVLVVESGDSLEVTGNMSIATTSGATGVVTNRGTMTVKDLDLGMYGGGKGALAQFDNFGTLTVANCLRMQIVGTPSVFYNHAGATVRKTGGSEYSFYFGVGGTGTYSTLINEGDFFDNSKETWMGQSTAANSKNDLIIRGNGRFFAAQNFAIGHVAGSLGTITLNDNGLLSGSATYRLGGSWQNASNNAEGRIVLNDNSHFAVSNNLFVGCTQTSKGSIALNDSAKMTMVNSEMHLAYGVSTTGSMTMGGNSRLVHETSSKNFLFGRGERSSGSMTLGDSASALIKSYAYVGSGNYSVGNLTLTNSAVFDIQRYIYVGVGTKSLGTVTLAGDSRMFVTNSDMVVGYNSGATGVLHIAENAQLRAALLSIGQTSIAGTAGFVTLSDNAKLVSPEVYLCKWGNAGQGTLTVADNSVITNIHLLQVGYGLAGTSATLSMRGGSIICDVNTEAEEFAARGYNNPLYLNPYRIGVLGRLRGWGKVAFADVRTYVTDAFNTNGVASPSGVTHYGQIIADGEGVMRDLDFSRFGALNYDTTDANPSGTNGWFAVNKGRLKLPRSLPNRSGYKCIGDCHTSNVNLGGQSRRLVNIFNYEFTGAETNHFVFSELYAPDRDDIPAGLGDLGADKIIAVWRIGYFSDGPEADDPENPVPFTSAKLRFKYSPEGLDGLNFVHVYRHDGSANGEWKRCGGLFKPSTTMPVVSTRPFEQSSENWNLGWFAIVGRVERPSGAVILFR
ncbi:MAG: hypothetical protein IKE55_10405 [Kiritimatiellae bacterium]|nr:hypothetical protein [Kiritimatiellia bacterium]